MLILDFQKSNEWQQADKIIKLLEPVQCVTRAKCKGSNAIPSYTIYRNFENGTGINR